MLAVTACAVTRTTNLAARCTGAAPFLPKWFGLRYANMGGLDHTDFAHQIREARSFRDNRGAPTGTASALHTRQATELLSELWLTQRLVPQSP
ncbi:hypothetical protein NWT09_31400 [Mycolicibacterium sp. jd]|uniref:hypothetical protein n=1 Tax=unclassified Mycolicibacterium TaxID=2636767 RepID=UPI00351BBD39